MRILHLSDTHLTRGTRLDSDGVDTRDSLRSILHDCREVAGLNAVVVTGDIADDGSLEAYIDALRLIGDFAGQRRIPAIFSTGNHDARAEFASVLGSGHIDAEGQDRPQERFDAAGGMRTAMSMVAGWRIITLDSLVPGKGYGQISTDQLMWLRGILAEPAPRGSILAFHHPPVAVPGVAVQNALGDRKWPTRWAVPMYVSSCAGTSIFNSSGCSPAYRFGSPPVW